MKKILATLLLTLLVVTIMAPMQTSANPGPTRFSIGNNINAVRGRQVTVPVSVTGNADGFAAVGFEINFNPAHLQLANARLRSDGVNAPSPTLRISRETEIKPVSDGTQWISILDANSLEDWAGEGVLLNLIFDVTAPVDIDRTSVNLNFTSSPNGRPVSAETGQLVPNVGLTDGGLGSVIISTSTEGPGGDRPPGQFGVTLANPGTNPAGSGWYASGATVSINAGTAPTGQQFSHWTAPAGVTLANVNSATTTFVMPASDVTVTANWVPTSAPPGGGGGGGGTTPPGGGGSGSEPGQNPGGGTGGSGSGGGAGSGAGGSGSNPPGFGTVPQTSIADISGTVIIMWVSLMMTAGFGISLFLHLKSNRKRVNFVFLNGKYDGKYNGNKNSD